MPRFNTTANGLAALGRNGDTMLMHVNPNEVAGLSALLGSEPTVNPDTGLPEAFNWLSPIMGVLGSAASLMTSSAVKEPLEEFVKDFGLESISEPLSLAGSGLMGAATNAGIGALGAGFSGGNASNAALAGALTGGAMGVYGGLESDNLLGASNTEDLDTLEKIGAYGTPGEAMPGAGLPNTEQPGFFDKVGANFGRGWEQNFGRKGGFKAFASEYGTPIMLGAGMQTALESDFGVDDLRKKQEEEIQARMRAAGINPQSAMYSYTYSTPSYADGGVVGHSVEFGIPTHVKIPQRFVDELQRAGGLAGLLSNAPEYAQGGYVNTQPFDPNKAYPQSMIPRAQPYAAAAPQRHDVITGYDDGGFVEGEGDGMSDDVPAVLEGEEEIRVADGEVIIPKAIVDMFGVDALDNMLKRVRMAAYGTDKQVEQDAGKEVVMDMLD